LNGTNSPGRRLITRLACLGALSAMPALPAANASAQVIRGVVLEAGPRTPIANATVELRPATRGDRRAQSTSDSLGQFVLRAPAGGVFAIQARKVGYLTAEPDTVEIQPGETITVEMRLDRNAVPLQPVVVTVRGSAELTEFERRRGGGFGRFLTRKDIESRGVQQTTSLFRLAPGFVVRPSRPHSPSSILLMRGTAGLCQPAVWIDGLYVATNPQTPLDDLVSPQMLEGVEIYNSVAAAPSQYRTGTCGVLLFWTRRGERTTGERFQWKKLAIGATVGALLVFIFTR
jgi:Carboxypeptidase regulatory-like domain/TonB-dependent Receptor Plug Domain